MKTWFKFYGQEYLSDPKMLSLNIAERSLWLTLLCLASSANEEGVIKYIDENKIKLLSGLNPLDDEWDESSGFLEKFQELGMVALEEKSIIIVNFNKRQETNLTGSERVEKYRKKHANVTNVTQEKNVPVTKVTLEKNRIDKKRIDKRESSLEYLSQIPEDDLEDFYKKYQGSKSQIQDKGDALLDYCKSHGKRYKDYRAMLENALRKDFGKRPVVAQAVEEDNSVPASAEALAEFNEKRKKLLGGMVI